MFGSDGTMNLVQAKSKLMHHLEDISSKGLLAELTEDEIHSRIHSCVLSELKQFFFSRILGEFLALRSRLKAKFFLSITARFLRLRIRIS